MSEFLHKHCKTPQSTRQPPPPPEESNYTDRDRKNGDIVLRLDIVTSGSGEGSIAGGGGMKELTCV